MQFRRAIRSNIVIFKCLALVSTLWGRCKIVTPQMVLTCVVLISVYPLYCIVLRVGMCHLYRCVIYSNSFWAVHFYLSFRCADRRANIQIKASSAVASRIAATSQLFVGSLSIALQMQVSVIVTRF